jgi:hypothetical protein
VQNPDSVPAPHYQGWVVGLATWKLTQKEINKNVCAPFAEGALCLGTGHTALRTILSVSLEENKVLQDFTKQIENIWTLKKVDEANGGMKWIILKFKVRTNREILLG